MVRTWLWDEVTLRFTANCTFAMNWSKTVMRPSTIFLRDETPSVDASKHPVDS